MKTTAPSRVRPHFSSGICLVTQEEKKGNKCEKMLSLTDSGFEHESSSPETMTDLDQSQVAPMSRTHQYRKVMKPLLERKRRARMNKSLDALKDLMVNVLQKEGESITKLEKAEILELTVKHIQKLRKENALEVRPSAAARNAYDGRFKAGFEHCAKEVSKFMTEVSGVDVRISSRLVSHLNSSIQALENIPPAATPPMTSGHAHFSSYATLFPSIASLSRPTPLKPRFSPLEACKTSSASHSELVRLELNYRKSLTACGIDDKAWRPW